MMDRKSWEHAFLIMATRFMAYKWIKLVWSNLTLLFQSIWTNQRGSVMPMDMDC